MMKCFLNIGRKLPNHTVQHPRRLGGSTATPLKHKITVSIPFRIYRVRESSMPKLSEGTAGTKTRIYFQGTKCRDGSLQRYGSSNWVWLSMEIKQKHWSFLKKKVVFLTNLEQMFKRTATDLDSQPTTQQRRLSCALKKPGCCLMVATVSTIKEMRFQYYKIFKTLKLTLRRLMSYIYGAPILDVSRSHTTTQHSR